MQGYGEPAVSAATRPCVICGAADKVRPWRTVGPWQYRECDHCSAVGLDPLPSAEDLRDYYRSTYFEGGGQAGYLDYMADEPLHRKNARSRVGAARRFGAKPGGSWLDVGCAVGFTLDEARSAGHAVHGVEVSDWASSVARTRFGLDVSSTLADARLALETPADVLTMFQVLEHLPDPTASLQEARACLGPGGLLLIETWDRRSIVARLCGGFWQQISPPSVLWLLDRSSIEELLRRTGFELVRIEVGSKFISIGWGLGLIADKLSGALQRGLRRIAKSRLGRITLRYRLDDLILVAARRPPADASGGS